MSTGPSTTTEVTRRSAIQLGGATAIATAVPGLVFPRAYKDEPMTVACFIRYQIDPFQRDAFGEYAANWGRIIPRCGGDLIGYFLPHEGANDVAWGLIGFDSLASYEAYRARLRVDPESQSNFRFATERKCILREERSFLQSVPGTFTSRPAR